MSFSEISVQTTVKNLFYLYSVAALEF
jgi:hypothetical protein